jgi:hypothetical protein
MQGATNMPNTETNQQIESLIINAEIGDTFGDFRQSDANRYQQIAWEDGHGIEIHFENASTRTYLAILVL